MENHEMQIGGAEMWLLAAGVVVVLVAIAVISTKNAWERVLRLPPVSANRLEPIDLVAAIIALIILPAFVLELVLFIAPVDQSVNATVASAPAVESATTQASQPTDADEIVLVLSPWQVAGTTLGQITVMVLLLLLGATRFDRGGAGWGLELRGWSKRGLQALTTFVGTWPICFGVLVVTMLGVRYFMPGYAPDEHSTIRILRSGEMPGWALAATALGAIVFAPIYEECFFRGILLPLVEKMTRSMWLAIAVSGVLFGLFHFALPHTMPALAVFGIILGYAYARTRSLTLVIFLHAIFNAKTLLWLWLGL